MFQGGGPQFTVHPHFHLIEPLAGLALFGRVYPEIGLFPLSLTPIDEFALVVPIFLLDVIHIHVHPHNAFENNLLGKQKALIQENGAHQGFERIAVHRLKAAVVVAGLVELNQLMQAHVLAHLVKAGTAHNFGTHLGEKTLVAGGIFLKEIVGNHKVQHRVAQELQTLVVAAVSVGNHRHRTMTKSQTV